MPESLDRTARVEEMIETLIKMLGRSNRKMDELSRQVRQIEQCLLESAPTDSPYPQESYSYLGGVAPSTPPTFRKN